MTASALRSIKSGAIKPLVEKWRFFKMSRPELYGGSYIKNAWAEIPEVIFFSVYGLAGLAMSAQVLYEESKYDEYTNR